MHSNMRRSPLSDSRTSQHGNSPHEDMELVILIGLQASGKSTFFRAYFVSTHEHISKDLMPNNKHPNRQGQGRGAELLRYVEQALKAHSGRVLLVETSGLPDFDRTRTFYAKCGFEEEARIRDFYATGDDKVVFRKILSAD